jgi:peptidoglycan/xylan/chitin deacetylase (PgdA/CDA1 family)
MPAHCDSLELPLTAGEIKNNQHRSYSFVHVDGPYIAITFDDGPSPVLTPRLLDILKEKGVKATFFVVGENAQNHPDILARAVAEGHEIGNHSWSHPQLSKISEARLQEEISNTSDAIFKATGKKPALLRPPYGAVNHHVRQVIQDQYRMKIIFWSVDPLDWKRPGATAVSQRILAGAKPGAIILSHDIHAGTVDAMAATINSLLEKGYRFVTVSELIEMESNNPAPVASTAPASKAKKRSKTSN